VFRLPAVAGYLSFHHSVRNGPRTHRGGVFPRSGREADHVTACHRMRGATPPLLDIPSCLIMRTNLPYSGLSSDGDALLLAESNAQTSLAASETHLA